MPVNELKRLSAVHRFLNLEVSKEEELQKIVVFAAQVCEVPTALITLLDEDTQHIRFKVGFEAEHTSLEEAFCNHAIKQDEVMLIPDALLDARFKDNPLVSSGPNIRFYAGSPLKTSDGHLLGSLCVIDQQPRQLSAQQCKVLEMLSHQVIQLLEFESSLSILKNQFIQARQSEIELRSFFESSFDCHLLLGRDFEILAFNKAVQNFIRKNRGMELERGARLGQFLHQDILKEFYGNYQKALRGTASFEQRALEYDGQLIHWVIKYEPAFDHNGQIIGVSVNSTDVSFRVRQEEKVAAQNDSLHQIALLQSHELRRPVSSIIGLLQLLRAERDWKEKDEFILLEKAVQELDEKIHLIVNHYSSRQ